MNPATPRDRLFLSPTASLSTLNAVTDNLDFLGGVSTNFVAAGCFRKIIGSNSFGFLQGIIIPSKACGKRFGLELFFGEIFSVEFSSAKAVLGPSIPTLSSSYVGE